MCDFEDNCIPFGLLSPRDQDLMKELWRSGNYEINHYAGRGFWLEVGPNEPSWMPTVVYRLKKKVVKKRETFMAYLLRDKVKGKTLLFNRVPIGPDWEVVATKEVTFEWEE